MGRWRPPQEASSPYITPQGARALKEELRFLWRERRPRVVRALSAAAAEGDRSENAEYIYRKKQLGEIDRRLRYLTRRLDVIEVVDRPPGDPTKVRFGAQVTLIDADDHQRCYRIVGADEIDARRGWISIDSPLARALLGLTSGDTVRVELPSGAGHFEVVEVAYPS